MRESTTFSTCLPAIRSTAFSPAGCSMLLVLVNSALCAACWAPVSSRRFYLVSCFYSTLFPGILTNLMSYEAYKRSKWCMDVAWLDQQGWACGRPLHVLSTLCITHGLLPCCAPNPQHSETRPSTYLSVSSCILEGA